jgi:hypothetical protein
MKGFAAKRAGREGLATVGHSTQRRVPSGLCFDARLVGVLADHVPVASLSVDRTQTV